MTALLTIVPIAPLAAAALNLFFGDRLPKRGAWMTVAGTLVALVALLLLPSSGVAAGMPWITLNGFEIGVGLRLDRLAWFMAVLVASIASIVNVYAAEFMESESEGRPRFYGLMALFASAMLTVVLADSLVLLFAAWEIMGVTSWGLISFWYCEEKPRRAAQMAFLVTRVGDVGFLLGWLLVLVTFGTTSIDEFLSATQAGTSTPGGLTLIALLLFAAAIGKSAQLPLTAWLPEAMVGPTPVSALIHSATMVAAGVYLVLRFYPLFQVASHALTVVLWVGTVTAVFAAFTASAQMDLKRILAWSTVSQLGQMMIALGLLGPAGALLLLAVHAVFKSGLFLAAGAVERAADAHTLLEMGGLAGSLPWIAAPFGACALALTGFPPFSGFWSGEKILAAASHSGLGWAMLLITLIFLDGVYISRAAAGVFLFWPGHRQLELKRIGLLLISTTLLLGAGALIVGLWLKSAVEGVAPRQFATEPGWGWTISAIISSILGLTYGTWRVLASGPVAAFGDFPDVLASGLYRATTAAARAVLAIGSHHWPERALDNAARGIAVIANQAARGVEAIETGGFDRGAAELASGIWKSGGRVRLLETGKLYIYTGGVFAWVILMILVFAAIWH